MLGNKAGPKLCSIHHGYITMVTSVLLKLVNSSQHVLLARCFLAGLLSGSTVLIHCQLFHRLHIVCTK